MFSSRGHLKRKTPENGINRHDFIEHLVEEYHTTTNIEAQEQVTANLANFAYDPINWEYLKESESLQLFVEVLSLPNERLQLHGLAGLCNIALDPQAFKFITKPENCASISNLFLKTENIEILLNCLTLYYQLLSEDESFELKTRIATPEILKRTVHWRQKTNDQRLNNLASIFLEDFGSRSECIELPCSSQYVGIPTETLL